MFGRHNGHPLEHSLRRSISGYTPLHEAAKQGHNHIIKGLASEVGYLNIKDRNGCTPLHYAAIFSKKDSYKLLLELGADPRCIDNFGRTAVDIFNKSQGEVELSGNNHFFDSCKIL